MQIEILISLLTKCLDDEHQSLQQPSLDGPFPRRKKDPSKSDEPDNVNPNKSDDPNNTMWPL